MSTTHAYLEGQLLIAMPSMTDPRFERSVVFICAHSADGAMGIVVNKPLSSLSFPELLKQLEIKTDVSDEKIQVYFGGPIEGARGFVLHSPDYIQDSTILIKNEFALSASIDILKAIAEGNGPRESLLALGYAGWAAGQLDQEIQDNGWLIITANKKIIFQTDNKNKWRSATESLGVDISKLSSEFGHA